MCNRIYLCLDCRWPICFPFGQKMHIGTGWYCWKEHRADEDEGLPDVPLPFEAITDAERFSELVEEGLGFYKAWKKDDKQRKVFNVMRRNLRQRRTDVVHEFLRRIHRDDKVGTFLRRFTATEEWRGWARRAIRKPKLRQA
ncbi:MAG: hypothetical protein ACRDH8_05955 [Actinomycetota bacterium]